MKGFDRQVVSSKTPSLLTIGSSKIVIAPIEPLRYRVILLLSIHRIAHRILIKAASLKATLIIEKPLFLEV